MIMFESTVAKYGAAFKADKNFTLVERLGHNVLKTGLRKLSLSYSRIELSDVAAKLRLPSRTAAEYICAKAIRDGVIEASIDHDKGLLLSNEVQDLYATCEPQKAFHKRIVFCLDVHNEAVKAMRYPPDAYRKELNADKKDKDKDKEEVTEEDIQAMQEEDD
jgi:26S proteasome regulatory subunit N3